MSLETVLEKKLGIKALNLLFPHKHNTGKVLEDFYLKRNSFLEFLYTEKNNNPDRVMRFVNSIINVDEGAYIGLYRRNQVEKDNIDTQQQPMKEDVKRDINPKCGHSVMYQCYEDSDKCLYCDIRKFQC